MRMTMNENDDILIMDYMWPQIETPTIVIVYTKDRILLSCSIPLHQSMLTLMDSSMWLSDSIRFTHTREYSIELAAIKLR